jgi:hypothetical protein
MADFVNPHKVARRRLLGGVHFQSKNEKIKIKMKK